MTGNIGIDGKPAQIALEIFSSFSIPL